MRYGSCIEHSKPNTILPVGLIKKSALHKALLHPFISSFPKFFTARSEHGRLWVTQYNYQDALRAALIGIVQ